jgi:hypothetical protein
LEPSLCVVFNWVIKKVYIIFFFCKLTYVLKEEDTKIIRGIPPDLQWEQKRKTTDGYRLASDQKTETSLDSIGKPIQPANYQIKNLCY